jgi:hypothetical protein
MSDLHSAKLGTTRAGEQTRIWLEGNRLLSAGFKPGSLYLKSWGVGSLVLTICTQAQFDANPRDIRGKVSGKEGKPIIDIVGQRVRDTFDGPRVDVAYGHRTITITEGK